MYNVGNQEKMHGFFPSPWMKGLAGFGFVALMVGSPYSDNGNSNLYAQSAEANVSARIVVGEVTWVEGASIEIDRQRYKLIPDAIIKDEKDNPRDMSAIVRGAMAKAQVKQGRIDQMILILPK